MNKKSHMGIISFLITSMIFLHGCAGLNTFPIAARSGDTVMLSAGSLDNLSKANAQVVLIDSNNVSHNLTSNVRNVIRIYPDKTSPLWLDISEDRLRTVGLMTQRAGHGPWLSTVVLDLPLSLPDGPATVRLSTPGAEVPNGAGDINEIDVTLEILPGTGVSNSFDYFAQSYDPSYTPGDISQLEQSSCVIVRPDMNNNAHLEDFMAFEIVIDLPFKKADGSLSEDAIAVVIDDKPQDLKMQLQSYWRLEGKRIYVSLFSPKSLLKSKYIRNSICIRPSLNPNNGVNVVGALNVVSYNYVDSTGNIISNGPAPIVEIRQ